MKQHPRTLEFDRTLITKAREREEATYLRGIENPSHAVILEDRLIQRAKGRSDASHINTKEARSHKEQCTTTLKKNWSRTETEKKNRIIRDLQFELAANRVAELKKLRSDAVHRDVQVQGIADFESSLFKSGLGGGDEEGGILGISYEIGEVYLDRIEDLARESFPDNDDIRKFVTQLKVRTREKKVARHEKERRKRKTAASNNNPFTPDAPKEAIVEKVEPTSCQSDSSEDELVIDVESARSARNALAEESIRKFAEESRLAYESSSHSMIVNSINQKQKQRAINKSKATHDTCRLIVLQMLSTIDYGRGHQSNLAVGNQDNSEVAAEMLNFVCFQLDTSLSATERSSFGSFTDLRVYDSWLSYAALSANIGHWFIDPDATSNIHENSRINKEEPTPVTLKEKVGKKMSLFTESAGRRLEALLTISCGSRAGGISLALGDDEKRDFYSAEQANNGFLLLLGGGNGADVDVTDMLQTIEWLGGRSNVEVWDVAAAIEFGRKISPLVEGKNPTISCSTLLEAFISNSVDVFSVDRGDGYAIPNKTIALTAKALKIAVEIADIAQKIMNTIQLPVTPAPSGGKAEGKQKAHAAHTASFTDLTFGILLGQVLWLRNFIKVLYVGSVAAAAADDDSECIKQREFTPVRSPFASIVIAGRCVGCNTSLSEDDSVSFALAVDWFMMGGSREGLNDSTSDSISKRILREALSLESEVFTVSSIKKGKDKSAPKGKGCGFELEPMVPSLLGGILRITGHQIPALTSSRNIPASFEVSGQQTSTDPNEVDAKVKIDPLNTPARRFISTYAMLQKQSVEVCKDTVSCEPVLTEIASQLGIPYLRLQCMGGVSMASTLRPTDCETILFSSGLSASEALLSFILASSKQYSAKHVTISTATSAKHGDVLPGKSEEVRIPNCCCSVSSVISKRRKRLSDAEQLWLSHISEAHPIDLQAAYNAHKLCVESRRFEVELIGTLLMSYGLSVSSLEDQLRNSEREIISCLKVNDSRFKNICIQAQQQLLSLDSPDPNLQQKRSGRGGISKIAASKEDRDLIISNCVCKLGDIIDERHMGWIALAASQQSKLENDLRKFRFLVQNISCKLAGAVAASHTRKAEAGRAVADLMINAQYSALPWWLPHTGSRATRRAADVRKDKLKSAALLLRANCGSDILTSAPLSQVEETGEDDNDPWKAIKLLDNPTRRTDISVSDTSLIDSIVDEVYAETLESSVSLLYALQLDLTAREGQYEEYQRAVQNMIVSRFHYEHSSLANWTSALRDSFMSSPMTGSIVDKSQPCIRYFDVTVDAGADKILSKMGLYAYELGEMTLPLHLLRSLSVQMVATFNDSVDLLSEDLFFKLLRSCADELGLNSLPSAWQRDGQLKNLVRLVLNSGQCSISGRLCSKKSFFQSLMSVLLLATIPAAPSCEFILRLGELFGGMQDEDGAISRYFSFPSTNRPSVAAFLQIILNDKKLASFWHRGSSESIKTTTISLENALFATASSCLDASGGVIIEQLMLLLCRVPLRSSCFERSLLFHADTLSSNYFHLDAEQLPSFSSEGIFKALTVASRIFNDPHSNMNCDPNCITTHQLKWLLEYSPDKISLTEDDVLHDIEIFRPSFSASPCEVISTDDTSSSMDTGEDIIEMALSNSDTAAIVVTSNFPTAYLVKEFTADILDLGLLILRSVDRDRGDKIPFCI